MNTLISVMTSLSEAKASKDTAKDRWLTAMEQGGEDVAGLKQAFHSADDFYANGAQTLAQAITDLKGIFCFELALSMLDRDQTQTLHKLVADLRLDHLTNPFQTPSIPDLAMTWYRAEAMREAAKTMAARFSNREEGETIASIQADIDHARKPDAWTATVEAYNFIFAAMAAQDAGELGVDLIASVLHYLSRHLLKQYDDLREKLADRLEDIYYAGNMSEILEELDPEIFRVIQDAVSSGLIRQRQTKPEEKPEARGVIVAESLADLEAQIDAEFSTEFGSGSDEEIDPDTDPRPTPKLILTPITTSTTRTRHQRSSFLCNKKQNQFKTLGPAGCNASQLRRFDIGQEKLCIYQLF